MFLLKSLITTELCNYYTQYAITHVSNWKIILALTKIWDVLPKMTIDITSF